MTSANAITAHGARIEFLGAALEIHPAALAAALTGQSEPVVVSFEDIEKVSVDAGDAWDGSRVTIATAAGEEATVRFAPGDGQGPAQLEAAVNAAREGGAEALGGFEKRVPGCDFVALSVETRNQNWASVSTIGAARVIDGAVVEKRSWSSVDTLIDDLTAFTSDLPIVAHNAYFVASAIRYFALDNGLAVPNLVFACSLAQARAADLDVADHKLSTLAEHLRIKPGSESGAADGGDSATSGITTGISDDLAGAETTAALTAEVMVELARRADHSGSLMNFVHGSGFTLGTVSAGRVTPSLRDYSGAQTAIQARQLAQGDVEGQQDPSTDAPVEDPKGDEGKKEAGKGRNGGGRRGPAPWQSVATPDTIPEPAVDADPDSPLYDQNVTLTGEFEPFDKGVLWDGIAAQGGQVGKNVTKKTTILVTGEWATMTSKEKRARELIEKGQDIQIWPADRLLAVLGLDEQPPF